jgi:cytochrome c-type biogenesis protein CcmH/NrfG
MEKGEIKMKKETVILIVVIAFLVGFVAGATVAVLRGTKGADKTAMVPKPQMAPPGAPAPAAPPRDSIEAASQIQTLKEIVKKDPKNLPAWVELGNLYFDTGQPKEAIEAYSQYLAIKPNNADVRTDMGIMYRKLGQFDRAIEEFRKAAQSDPKHINSRYNTGLVLLHDKQDIKGAVKAWEDYLKVDPNSERAQRIRAQMEKMKSMPMPAK